MIHIRFIARATYNISWRLAVSHKGLGHIIINASKEKTNEGKACLCPHKSLTIQQSTLKTKVFIHPLSKKAISNHFLTKKAKRKTKQKKGCIEMLSIEMSENHIMWRCYSVQYIILYYQLSLLLVSVAYRLATQNILNVKVVSR